MDELKLLQFKEKMKLFGYAERTMNESVAMMRQFFRYLQENENLTSIQQLKEEHVKAWQTYLTFEKFPRKGRN
ncbi:MAG: hypothetical protein KKF93_04795, partial [Candidatus Omnitrophica bacterium]|nr:hypothetical protein [Candidatus Omnitrophota bacterium]